MLGRRDVLAGLAALPLARPAIAAEIVNQTAWNALIRQGLYLPLLREPRGAKNGGAQFQSQICALVGDEDSAFRLMPQFRASTYPPDLTGATCETALAAIARAAKDRQIVILNEAHHISRCRVFALDVASMLRAQGFAVFAAEALNNDGDPATAQILNAGGPLTTDFGLYPDDPVYAELLRGARASGYRFAAYEARYYQFGRVSTFTDARISSRELAEADNFITEIFAGDPHARVFVYCGYGHVYKTPQDGTPWFAARIRAKTGIDPLCISQAWGVPPPDPALEPDDLKAVLDRFEPTEPIVVSDGNGHPLSLGHSYDGALDLSVFHQRLPRVAGRPGWLAKAPGRKRMTYRLAAPTPEDGLLQAVRVAEASATNAIPSDQFLVSAGTTDATFFLVRGDYEIHLETDAGRKLLDKVSVA
jgi:hypothetical protein